MENIDLFADINPELVAWCQRKVAKNDPAHQWRHIQAVARNSIEIATIYKLEIIPFLLASIFHDVGRHAPFNETHEVYAGYKVRFKLPHTEYGRYSEVVARMCEEHRSSYKGEYTGIMEMAFAAADRGPYDFNNAVMRALMYRTHGSVDFNASDMAKDIAAHLHEKFGEEGYMKPNIIHTEVYGKGRADYVRNLELLDGPRLMAIYMGTYKE